MVDDGIAVFAIFERFPIVDRGKRENGYFGMRNQVGEELFLIAKARAAQLSGLGPDF
jgi:hypothetical protein